MLGFDQVVGRIKDLATIAAILGGGGWTVYTFSALGSRARAQADLFKQAVLDISVVATQESADLCHDAHFPVSAVATIINKGSRNTFLDFRKRPPFRLYKVDFSPDGVGRKAHVMDLEVDSGYMTLRTGATGKFSVFFAVGAPGLYAVEFWVALSASELEVHEATAQDKGRTRRGAISWSGETHFVVHDPSVASTLRGE